MFNLKDSDCKITKVKEVSQKLIVGSLYTTHKTDNNTFEKTFIDCKIVGDALVKFIELGLKDRSKFTILEGVIRNEPYINNEGKKVSKNVVTIFKIKEYEDTEK